MPWSMRTEGGQVLVVRQRDKKVVGRHKDRKRALAQLRVLSSLEKAQFASRSEAGRYAANMRWQGNKKGDDKKYPKELTTKEMINILYKAQSVQDALGLIAKSLGKDAKPQLRVLDDSEVTHYRGASDPTASIGFVLDWNLNDITFATWGQGLYITPLREEASFYGKPYRMNLDKSAKLIVDEIPWSEGDKWLKVKSSEPYESSKVVNYSKLKFNPSGSDLINFYWASKGYDGAFIQGDEVVLFNGSKLTVDKRDLSSKEIKKFLTNLVKASFGGDRSEAGRYAANMRWQGQGQKEQEKVGLDGYPKINNDLEELFINTPILNSGLGKTMEEINKEVSERESESRTEDEILPMVIFSSYLGKGSNEFYGALNRHLRRGNPLKDSLREKLSEEDEEQVERLEREIRQLERDQDEDDDTDNSSEIESLREEIAEIEGEDDDDERIDADDWNYDEHSESDFDSQYGSIPISINGEDVKMPKVVAYGLMDDAFRELSMVMPSNLRVYRGIDPETITSLEASVGKTVEDLGFCSTSTDPNKAIAFSGVGVPMQSQLQTEYYKEGDTLSSDKRIATILIPKGLKVVMPNRGGEGEVILNRGTQFEVVGVNETGPILKVVANNENN